MTSYVKAMYDFTGEPGSSEISITTEEILTVTRTDVGDGWWEGRKSNGHIGLFPAAYVEVMSAADVALQLNGSTGNTETTSPESLDTSKGLNSNMRYDAAYDYNEGEDWEDDWDDENETYSEIGPTNQSTSTSFYGQRELNRNTVTNNNSLSNVTSYDSKTLPVAPYDASVCLSSNQGSANSNNVKKSGMFTKSSDSYILGYGNKEKLSDNEMVVIIHVNDFYHWQPNEKMYTVRVASPKKETKFKGMKSFIAYQLTPSFNSISVSRRYKHFDWLHERLVEKFCFIPIPPLPDKQISGRYEEQFVEHRRVQLQEFVDWVCRHPVLSKCKVWYHFLTCTNDKMWKSGKRKAERDYFVGVTYCWAIVPPEKQLLQSFVDVQIESFSQFTHSMDLSIRNLLSIASEQTKRNITQSKKDMQRIGDGISDLAKSLSIDERRASATFTSSLSESVGKIGGIFIGLGQLFYDQPKLDWIPLSDRLHIYRGILNMFPDILSTHKGAMQKRKECERFVSEQKMGNAQLADVNRRTDVISYAVIAEMSHFREQRNIHLKQTLKHFIEEQIKFYSAIVCRLEEAYQQFH